MRPRELGAPRPLIARACVMGAGLPRSAEAKLHPAVREVEERAARSDLVECSRKDSRETEFRPLPSDPNRYERMTVPKVAKSLLDQQKGME